MNKAPVYRKGRWDFRAHEGCTGQLSAPPHLETAMLEISLQSRTAETFCQCPGPDLPTQQAALPLAPDLSLPLLTSCTANVAGSEEPQPPQISYLRKMFLRGSHCTYGSAWEYLNLRCVQVQCGPLRLWEHSLSSWPPRPFCSSLFCF